ncbi:MAG TPA: RDD family protein [Candidatus Angelobacter sp.]|nr:RDD family protein [Candidatus Angelobacter sp.]
MSESESPCEGEWRREVASRVQQHRARRGGHDNLDQALAFDFSSEEALIVTDGPVVRERVRRRFESDILPDANREPQREMMPPEPPKIIRFPRSATMLPDVPVQAGALASEPALPPMEAPPRILNVEEEHAERGERAQELAEPERPIEPVRRAEQMELLPSFEDITLDAEHHSERPHREVIARPAALPQRLIALVVDVATVAAAVMLFDIAFVRMAEDNPHSRLALLFGLCVSGTLWTVFQYLFLVHGKGTPGMRFAQLELTTFDGKRLTVMTRRCRAAASALSAASIGLGYAWAFVDEDQLGWHDRITRTLLRSSAEPMTEAVQWWE